MITFTINITELSPGTCPVILLASGVPTPEEKRIASELMAAIRAHAESSMKAAGGGKMFEKNLGLHLPPPVPSSAPSPQPSPHGEGES